MLSKTIDGLFIGTRYGVWVLAILGIPMSLVLLFCNFSNGIEAIIACFAALLLSAALILLLAPKSVMKYDFLISKRYILGALFCILAVVCMGISVLVAGGLPVLNLIFI